MFELPLEFRSSQLAVTELPVIVECVHHADDGGVGKHVPLKIHDKAELEQRPPLQRASRLDFKYPIKAGPQGDVGKGHNHSADGMQQPATPPGAAMNRK